MAYDQGDLERAEAQCLESLHILQEVDEDWFRACSLNMLGKAAFEPGAAPRHA